MENLTTISKLKKIVKRPRIFNHGITIVGISLLLFLATFFAPQLSQFSTSDADRLENIINKRLETLSEIGNKWLNDTCKTEKSAFDLLPIKTINKFDKENLAVYFYDSTQLVAWSNIPNFPSEIIPSLDSTLKMMKFNDGWYLVSCIEKKQKLAVLSIQVQSEYRINNKFLENKFNPTLGIPSSFTLTSEPCGKENPTHEFVVRHKGKPIFALNKGTNPGYNLTLKDFFAYLSFILLIIGCWSVFFSLGFGRNARVFFFSLISFNLLFALSISWISKFFTDLYLFSPELYSSNIAPSLGTLTIYVLVFVVSCSVAYFHYVDYKIPKNKMYKPYAWLSSFFIATTVIFVNYIIYSLVNDSTIAFGVIRIAELSRYTLITYSIISLLVISIILLVGIFARLFGSLSAKNKIVILAVPISIVSLIAKIAIPELTVFLFFAASIVTFSILVFVLKSYQRIGIGRLSLIIVAWAISTAICVSHFIVSRDTKNRIAFAEMLYNENDPIVEASLPDITEMLKKDATITKLIQNPSLNDDSIYNHIKNKYFGGYMSRYSLIITICPLNANLYLSAEKKTTNCKQYFENLFLQSGSKVPDSQFYYIRNYPGQISYMGYIDYPTQKDKTTLYVEFDAKTINNNPGYPELLLKKVFTRNNNNDKYDYAHYMNGVLAAKYGSYSFPSMITPPTLKQKTLLEKANGYTHLYYRFDENNTMVVSRPNLKVFDIASCFSYIFLFLSFLGLIILKRSRFPLDDSLTLKTFKGKITLSFIFVLTVALLLTAVASLVFGVIRFNTTKQKNIQDKMKSAIPAVQTALNNPNPNALSTEMVKVSNYLYVDVNLYNTKGELFATSRPEIFYEGLQGFKLSPKAYKQLVIDHDGFFVDEEHVGNMSFTSSYAPIFDNNGALKGYVNLPYFMQYNDLRRELYTIAIATINIFILLLLPAIFIGVLISNSITRPLALIRSRMRTFDLKTNPDPIPYIKNDEIGDLIVEFNKMISQLEVSAQKLAASERDMAWREMARQIAHEIKNPLTPMKLSLQYLMMMKSKKDERWLDQFDRYATSQIEQIDSLAKIASEFSDFAKINFDEKTPVFDLRELVNEILPIYDGYPNLEIVFHTSEKEASIKIDKEHMKRVIVNLLKNATQAVDKDKYSHISVKVERTDNLVILSVKDDGKGMDEEVKRKIFTPNFTTKTSGSGLGLAISRNLLETYNGRIWFESELGIGTTFFVELPLATSNE